MIVVLDANNLAARSFHAAKYRMSSEDGTETGSLHLFVRSLAMHLAQLRPHRFVACWDGGGSTYREGLYPNYKIGRRSKQSEPAPHRSAFALIEQFLDVVGLAQWQRPGIEADDLIAAAVRRHQDTPDPITILSADHDLLQLLARDGIEQIRFSSANTGTDLWTRDRVIADFSCTPEQMPLVMALTGDASDSIPGARGIGPVKALRLLQTHDWDFGKVVASLPDGEFVTTCLSLVDLTRVPVEVPEVPRYEPISLRDSEAAWQRVADFCARYQLRVLWEELANQTLLAQGSPG